MGSVCGTYEGQQRCLQGFGAETEGRSLFLRPSCRLEDNIKMDVQEVESGTNWNYLAQGRD
jgi:hypothetical protein